MNLLYFEHEMEQDGSSTRLRNPSWDFRQWDNEFYANDGNTPPYQNGQGWKSIYGKVAFVGLANCSQSNLYGTNTLSLTSSMGHVEDHPLFVQFEVGGAIIQATPDKNGRFGILIPASNSNGGPVTEVLIWSSGTLKRKIQISDFQAGINTLLKLGYGDLDANDHLLKSDDYTNYFLGHWLGRVSMTHNVSGESIYWYDTNCDLNRNGEVIPAERDRFRDDCYFGSADIAGDSW